MSGLVYDDAAAERLEAAYLGPDVVAQRRDTLERLAIAAGERVLDIGSGPGFLARDLAERAGPSGAVVGIDISEAMVARAAARNDAQQLRFLPADATALPFDAESFDVVVSTQVAEYVPDVDALCAEAFRVARAGGRGLFMATDWDAVCWHASDPARMRRVLAAFEPHCADSRLPRTFGARLRRAGFRLDKVGLFPIINVDRYEGCYSQSMIPLMLDYVRGRGAVSDDDLTAWAADLDALNARGEHFFSTSRFVFEVSKPGAV